MPVLDGCVLKRTMSMVEEIELVHLPFDVKKIKLVYANANASASAKTVSLHWEVDPTLGEVTIQEGQVQGTLSLEYNQMTAEKYIACPQLGWELSYDSIIKTFWQLVSRLGQIEHDTTCANTSSDGNYTDYTVD